MEEVGEEEAPLHRTLLPKVSPTPETLVGPLGRAVSAATKCSSEVPRIDDSATFDVESDFGPLTLAHFTDGATVMVHASVPYLKLVG